MSGRMTGLLLRRRRTWIAMAILAALVGCGLFEVEDSAPETARILVEGDAGLQVQVATSTRFLAGASASGGEPSVSLQLLEADTVARSLPMDETIDVRSTGRIYVVILATPDDTPAIVTFEAWLDGERKAVQTADLSQGDLTFLFVFGEGVLTGDIIEI